MSIGPHLQRTSGYSALLAERLGLDADLIRVASRLHDVGMAAVTDGVLSKPDPLTPEERREMQDHAQLGHAMLAGSGVEPLETAAEIALTHHEALGRRRLPARPRSEEIPLSGRIVAVADAFDALTTWRVYQPPRSVEVLTDERGRQFDPNVVDAFAAVLGQVLELRDRQPVVAGEEEA